MVNMQMSVESSLVFICTVGQRGFKLGGNLTTNKCIFPLPKFHILVTHTVSFGNIVRQWYHISYDCGSDSGIVFLCNSDLDWINNCI